MSKVTLALHSNRVVQGDSFIAATVLVTDEKILAVIEDGQPLPEGLAFENLQVEELGDKVLLPGLVDSHVHVNEPGRTEWEGFNTATSAAAAGGITTVVDMPLNCSPVTTTADALQQKLDILDGKLWVDAGFWGGVVPQHIDELPALLEAGVLGVKSFTIHSGIDEFPKVEPDDIRRAIPILARYDVPYLIHAELDDEQHHGDKIGSSYQSFLASRPRSWEDNAIDMMINLMSEAKAQGSDGRVHIVHLSSADAVPAIRKARESGLKLTTESCPHYLTLFAESIPDGKTLYKCCPPIREDENRQRLWQGLADGDIDFVVSDHSPCTPDLKHIDSGDIEKAWGGISSLQFGLSIIWSEAQVQGYSLPQVVDWMATRPAEFAGLSASKGQIAPGFDADLVVFDDVASYEISAADILYRNKITPYEGKTVSGRVERTYLRGSLVWSDGKMAEVPTGRPILHKRQTP